MEVIQIVQTNGGILRRRANQPITTKNEGKKASLDCTISVRSTRRNSRRNKVGFVPHVMVYDVPSAQSFSDDQLQSIWYSREDISRIKQECTETVKLMIGQHALDPDTQCSRGLEFRTPEGLKRRQRNKHSSIDAVLDEQDRQWDNDEEDAEYLADVYRDYSLPCQAMAHRMGLRDQRCVQIMYSIETPKNSSQCETLSREAFLNNSTGPISPISSAAA